MTDQEISQLSEELQVLALKVSNLVLCRDIALLQSEQSKLPMTGAQAQEMLGLLRAIAADMAAIRRLNAKATLLTEIAVTGEFSEETANAVKTANAV